VRLLDRLAQALPVTTVHAHCDLPCGIYDPAQARIDAASIVAIDKKMAKNPDPQFQTRGLLIKERVAEQVKHHLWVLWTDYFKPNHLEQFPQLHDLFWRATKAAGATKHSADVAKAEELLGLIDQIGELFAQTKPGYDYAPVVANTKLQVDAA